MFVILKYGLNIALSAGTIVSLFLMGCGAEEPKGETLDAAPEVKHSSIDTAEIQGSLRSNDFTPHLAPHELLANFNYCRDNAETEFTCKFYIAKAVSDYYGIDDFKEGDSYIDFEKIKSIVENSSEWEVLGEARDQNVLEKAQIQANKGIPTIGIYTADNYGHVVLILKGNLAKAQNWKGLMVPNCASFFMVKNLEPFVNKSMAYAFSSPESVYLYTKK